VNIVRHDDTGQSKRIIEAADQAQYDAHGDRVKAHERLVVDQDFRIHDDRARQRHAPAHAARQLRGHQIDRTA
jgi:hypothetical protein